MNLSSCSKTRKPTKLMIRALQLQVYFIREEQVISLTRAIRHLMRASKKTYLIILKSFKNRKRVRHFHLEGMPPNSTSYLLKILSIQPLLFTICGMESFQRSSLSSRDRLQLQKQQVDNRKAATRWGLNQPTVHRFHKEILIPSEFRVVLAGKSPHRRSFI